MKKVYFAPAMEIVEIKVQQMLTTSLPQNNGNASYDGDDYNHSL